jgi:hypothetical protein
MTAVGRASHLATPQLRAGFSTQYAHDEEFIRAGIEMTPAPYEISNFDRTVQVNLQDDKLATYATQHGGISLTHTISHDEFVCWNNNIRKEIDTIIHSFELLEPFVDGREYDVRYRGAISWLRVRPYIKEQKSSYLFDREQALKYSLA